MSFSLSLSRKRRLPGPQNAQNAGAEGGGFPSGCPRAFSLCLSMKMPSRKRLFSASKNRACDGLFPLPAEEKQLFRATPPSIAPPLPPEGPGGLAGCACDGLSSLPVEEKAIMGLGVRLRWPFPPACRGKGRLMDLVCACDGLFPLPVEEKAVSRTWRALAMGFSLCLSRKRPYRGLGVRLRWAFPPACRAKGRLMDLACACNGLFPFFFPACRGKGRLMVLVYACDGIFPLPVEEKAVSWTFHPACRRKGRNRTSRALAIAFSPCPSKKRPSQGLGVRLQWPFPPACRGKGYHETCLSRTRLFQHTPSMFWSPQVEGLCSPITPTVLVGGCPKDKHVPSPEGEEF